MKSQEQMRKGTTTVIILSLLQESGRAMHGYEIIRELEARSQGYFRFQEGLIYPRLHEMEQQGLLGAEWEGEEGARRRKLYTITDRGRRHLAEEVAQWQAFSAQVDALLGLEGSPA